jgi:serine/threonine-protein kinase
MRASRNSAPSYPSLARESDGVTQTLPYFRTTTLGHYRLIAQLGRGGMGEVFLAIADKSENFRKLCVVKRVKPELAQNPASRTMFINEGSLAARLNHPNIAQTFEVGECRGVLFLAMEFIEGQSLRDVLAATKKCAVMPDADVWVRIVADALSGLHHAHELEDFDGTPLGIVHRDISPHNILVSYEGVTRIIDFGVAKVTARASQSDSSTVTGKLGYLAPEYLDGEEGDRRADIFSMGVVLWEALAGKRIPPPLQVTRAGKLAYPRLASAVPRIDPKLDAICARALAMDPNERFKTAEEMRVALEQYLGRKGVTPVRPADVGMLVDALFHEDRKALKEAIRVRTAALGGLSLPVRRSSPAFDAKDLVPAPRAPMKSSEALPPPRAPSLPPPRSPSLPPPPRSPSLPPLAAPLPPPRPPMRTYMGLGDPQPAPANRQDETFAFALQKPKSVKPPPINVPPPEGRPAPPPAPPRHAVSRVPKNVTLPPEARATVAKRPAVSKTAPSAKPEAAPPSSSTASPRVSLAPPKPDRRGAAVFIAALVVLLAAAAIGLAQPSLSVRNADSPAGRVR